MKKKLIALCCIAAALLLLICLVAQPAERRVTRYFEAHRAEFAADAEGLMEGDDAGKLTQKFKAELYHGEDMVVEYHFASLAVAPSGSYRGIFRSENDVPFIFTGGKAQLEQISADEWRWQAEGDDHGYIRRIEPHWFYYEAAF